MCRVSSSFLCSCILMFLLPMILRYESSKEHSSGNTIVRFMTFWVPDGQLSSPFLSSFLVKKTLGGIASIIVWAATCLNIHPGEKDSLASKLFRQDGLSKEL